ncbi:MAG: hypothetical protein AB1632_10570 [Nitrospirota bacterium]
MKKPIIVLFMLAAFLSAGCTGDKAAELYDTAQFEELQNNREHAMQLYSEVVKKYPESEHAKKAKQKLSELRKEN